MKFTFTDKPVEQAPKWYVRVRIKEDKGPHCFGVATLTDSLIAGLELRAIAPRMTAIESGKLAKGAIGASVRLFVRYIEQWGT